MTKCGHHELRPEYGGGAVAKLGSRLNGIEKVEGSSLSGSIQQCKYYASSWKVYAIWRYMKKLGPAGG